MAAGEYRIEHDGQICIACAQSGDHISDYLRVRGATNDSDLDGVDARALIDQCSSLFAQQIRIYRMHCMYMLVILHGQCGNDGQNMRSSSADSLNICLNAGTTTRV